MTDLFHGTSERRFRQIIADGIIRCAPYGDRHVSTSRSVDVARHFAEMACDADECDHGHCGRRVVFAIDMEGLMRAGYGLREFVSENSYDDEQEMACLDDIPVAYVSRIEFIGNEQWRME